jgi:anaerobic selenocysteine-containing dehydrogenase
MKLKAKPIWIEALGKSVVVLQVDDAEELGTRSSDRVRVRHNGKELTVILNTSRRVVRKGEIGVFEGVQETLGLEGGETLDVDITSPPNSELCTQ